MTKHTAGPWRVGDAGGTVFGPPNGNPAPERIATLANRGESTKPNAHLIAAAPDMLAALATIRDTLLDVQDGYASDPAAAMENAMILAARIVAQATDTTPRYDGTESGTYPAAIAKATGE